MGEGDPTGSSQEVGPGAPSAGGGGTCGGLLLGPAPYSLCPGGAPLPCPTFRVVEETQGGGGDEGVHGLPA